ncbi:MAG TPA: hypothetical protein VGO57_02155, partial [Verrucomicrobiae bacterium]
MPDPIKIIVEGQTDNAVKELEQIPPAVKAAADETARYNEILQQMAVRQEEARRAAVAASSASTSQWANVGKNVTKTGEELNKHIGNARIGLLELEHTGRATMDILLMGGNPRMLLAQIPQIVQSLSLMGVRLATMVPYLTAAGVAVGVGAVLWSDYKDGILDTTKQIDEMVAALDKVPGILEKIASLQKGGLISSAAAGEFADYLNGRKPLYVGTDGKVTPQSQSLVRKPIITAPTFTGPGSGQPVVTGFQDVMQNNPRASQDQINQYVQSTFPAVSEAQSKAAAQLEVLQKKVQENELSGIEKTKAAIHDRYQAERDELQKTLDAAGNLVGPGRRAAAQQQIQDSHTAEQYEINDAVQKDQQKTVQEQLASQRELRTNEAERTRTALEQVEDKITAMSQQQGVQRGQFAAVEYSMRINALQRAYFAGDLAEDEYTHRVSEAVSKRVEGEKSYQDSLKQTTQLKQELARTEAELQLHAIQTNPFLSESEKAAQSIGPIKKSIGQNAESINEYMGIAATSSDQSARIQALTKINQLSEQQLDLQRQLQAAQGEDSVSYQLGLSVKHLKDMNNQAKEVAQSFENIFNGGITSISNGLTGLIMGTMTWRQFLAQIPTQILTQIVSAITEMGTRWVATQVLMSVEGRAIQTSNLAAMAPL